MTEAQFQAQVIDYARLRGWRVAHFRPAMTKRGTWVTAVAADGKGYPDLTMVRVKPTGGGRIIFAELKANNGNVKREQDEWLTLLTAAEVCEVYVWKPKDWAEIEEVLK